MLTVCKQATNRLAIDLSLAEHITSMAPGTCASMIQAVLFEADQQRQSIRDFVHIVRCLEEQYRRRVYASEQLIHQLEAHTAGLDQQHKRLEMDRAEAREAQGACEQELPHRQVLVQTLERKRKERQHLYDVWHWVPLLASRYYKQRYLHARNKHAEAEEAVARLREALEQHQDALRRVAHALRELLEERDQTARRCQTVRSDLNRLHQTLATLDQGHRFWQAFEKDQIRLVVDAARRVWEQEHPTYHWTKTFQMACFEYAECLQYGRERWTSDRFQRFVEFDCTNCHRVCRDTWPALHQGQLAAQLAKFTGVQSQCQTLFAWRAL
ncbi:hypothetical protein BCR43DRAFT_514950 [Syncephalastrum racemosum]|uniref:Uncharacterized protein n=1 Tax=Syncephalastrum racemosum TaxID=13706 RepID=A0A1X2HCQ4_SYNRA|nr:hypothetical protein BCR43DRAFT_514950 [Syncephalastrum racemosum]